MIVSALKVSSPDTSIKRCRLADWIKKTKAYDMMPAKSPFQGKIYTQIKSERMEKDISYKWK